MTTDHVDALQRLSDRELIAETHRLVERDRQATAHVIAALMEMDTRGLHRAEGCSSLFTYCTQVLHFSEHAAYGRIEAARAARRFPGILDRLADGSLTLTTLGLLAPHLTAENHRGLLADAQHKSKRDVEQLVAALRPLPAVPSSVRKLPAARPVAGTMPLPPGNPPSADAPAAKPIEAATSPFGDNPRPGDAMMAAASPPSETPRPQHQFREVPLTKPAVVAPLAPERYKVQITISREAHDKLRRAQDLLRHSIPNGDPAAIVERALTLLVEDLERKKLATVKRPRPTSAPARGSRHVPAAVKREVWARDEGRCAFVGHAGRCPERGFLEFHHVIPFADGGATDAANLQVRCRVHNAYEAEEWFGPLVAREEHAGYSVRTELLVSSVAWATTQESSGLSRRGIQRSAAQRSRQAVTGATPSG